MKKLNFAVICLLVSFNAFALKLPDGSEARVKNIQLDENGILSAVLLSEPAEVTTSVGKVEAAGCILFNEKGKITEVTVNKNTIVDTPMGSLPIKGNTVLKFYDSGCIKNAVLSNVTAFSIKGTVYSAKADQISFHERWKVNEMLLSKDIALQLPCGIIPLKADSKICFSPRGALNQVTLGEPVLLETKIGSVKASGVLVLYDNGVIQEATADSAEMLQTLYGPIYPVAKSVLEFYSDGQLKSVIPQDVSFVNTKNHTYYIAAEKKIQYFKSGILREAYITGYSAKIYGWKFKFSEDLNRVVFYPKYKAYLPNSKVSSVKQARALKNFDISGQNEISERKFMLLPSKLYFWNANEESKNPVHAVDLATGSDTEIKEIKGSPCDFDENENFYYKKSPLLFNDENELIGYRYCSTPDGEKSIFPVPVREIYFEKQTTKKHDDYDDFEETDYIAKPKVVAVPEPVIIPEPYQEDEDVENKDEQFSIVENISETEEKSVSESENIVSDDAGFIDSSEEIIKNENGDSNEEASSSVIEYELPDEESDSVSKTETENETETISDENYIMEENSSSAEKTADSTETVSNSDENVSSAEKTAAEEQSKAQVEPFPDYLLPENQKRRYGEGLTDEELRALRKFEKDVVSPELYVEEDVELEAEKAAENEIASENIANDAQTAEISKTNQTKNNADAK